MPELPEVETTKNSLSPISGYGVQNIDVFQPKLRWSVPNDIKKLEGYRLVDVQRRAKYLILLFSLDKSIIEKTILSAPRIPSLSLIIHLGMSGSLQQYPLHTKKRKHDHVIFTFKNTSKSRHDKGRDSVKTDDVVQLHYHDPRRFGAILWHHDYANKLFDHLGVEPLDDSFTGDYLYKKIHRIEPITGSTRSNSKPKKPYNRSIKSIIMDQAFVVGVGNIYATESLFLSGIHPNMPANTLSVSQIDILVAHIKAILKRAIEQGGSTLRDFTVASGTTGYFQQTLNVYGRYKELCPVCDTPIDKIMINGRTSTFCPICQKMS